MTRPTRVRQQRRQTRHCWRGAAPPAAARSRQARSPPAKASTGSLQRTVPCRPPRGRNPSGAAEAPRQTGGCAHAATPAHPRRACSLPVRLRRPWKYASRIAPRRPPCPRRRCGARAPRAGQAAPPPPTWRPRRWLRAVPRRTREASRRSSASLRRRTTPTPQARARAAPSRRAARPHRRGRCSRARHARPWSPQRRARRSRRLAAATQLPRGGPRAAPGVGARRRTAARPPPHLWRGASGRVPRPRPARPRSRALGRWSPVARRVPQPLRACHARPPCARG
mmetsp:Transcript_15257/g.63368  ORF Transcript_15257/g.63368 Transcript_15257/m.63368 type:complete len:282 (+) Transcript_15257:1425-2270(+)